MSLGLRVFLRCRSTREFLALRLLWNAALPNLRPRVLLLNVSVHVAWLEWYTTLVPAVVLLANRRFYIGEEEGL